MFQPATGGQPDFIPTSLIYDFVTRLEWHSLPLSASASEHKLHAHLSTLISLNLSAEKSYNAMRHVVIELGLLFTGGKQTTLFI